MTNLELDVVMRHVLLDSLRNEEAEDCIFAPSKHYLREMKYMLKDPAKWQRNRTKPVWKQIVQKVAVILLIVSLAFGGVMVVSPTARAAVKRWVMELYETKIVYRYFGEQLAGQMQHYELTKLPEGYTETDRIETEISGSVFYENGLGGIICFDYTYMQQGGAEIIYPNDNDVIDVQVNGTDALLFVPHNPEGMLTLAWVDERANVQFCIVATHDEKEMLRIAENIRLKK